MYSLAIKNFLRSKGIVLGLILMLIIGLLSLLIGQQFIEKQTKAIAETTAFQREHIARNVQYVNKEMGLLLYYLKFALINKPHPLNALSIGQRDVNPTIQSVTIRGLENQKYDTDLSNPANLLLGNLDFSFVLLYLFPLLIIGLTYNLLSEEREEGTLRLVAAQAKSVMSFLFQKIFIRILAVFSVFFTLILAAIGILSLPINADFGAFVGLSILYILFWFALSFWVVSLHKNSGFNALNLLAVWVLLTLLLPAALNNYLTQKYPVPEALSTMQKQREGYHEKWDMPKQPTVDKFNEHYPQFKKYPLPDKTFSWLWYYAMQQMGDDDARKDADELKEKLRQRELASNDLALFIPTLHTQFYLNRLAHADLSNHLQFLSATDTFHEKKRLYFYPKIFEEQAVNSENWSQFKVEYFEAKQDLAWLKMFLPLVFASLTLGIWGVFKLKKPYAAFE